MQDRDGSETWIKLRVCMLSVINYTLKEKHNSFFFHAWNLEEERKWMAWDFMGGGGQEKRKGSKRRP